MRLTASATTTALVVLAFASCAPMAAMPVQGKAACAAMTHHCGDTFIETVCCSGQGDRARALVATRSAAAVALESGPVEALAVAGATPLATVLSAAGRVPLKPPGHPAYLLNSSFRL